MSEKSQGATEEPELDPLNEGSVSEAGTSPTPDTDQINADPVQETEALPEVDSVQKRINKITAQKYAAQREAESLRRELEAVKAVASPQDPMEPPTLEGHGYDEEKYTKAMVEHEVARRLDAVTKQKQQEEEAEASQRQIKKFTDREAAYSADAPGYADAIKNLPQLPVDVLQTIYAMEDGPQVAHFLGEHLDTAVEIAHATGYAAAMKLGQISAKIASKGKTNTPTSTAPDPVATLPGGSGGSKPVDEMTMDEIMQL